MRAVADVGRLWDLVQQFLDEQPLGGSERQLATRLGYASSSTFDGWRNPRKLPSAQGLARFALLSGTPYQRVLDAALEDTGYLPRPDVTDGAVSYRNPGKAPRGQQSRDQHDQSGEPETDDPGDFDPR